MNHFNITHHSSFKKILLFFLISNCFIIAQSSQLIRSKHGMVVSASELASKVGTKIMEEGGNAIDAAVATGFALAVTYPFAGNLGGGGYMVIHLSNGKNTAIDYREKAPLSAYKDMYLVNGEYVPSLSREGATSVAVPGSVAGLIYALNKYGTMPLAKVIQPAIDLAKDGWILDYRTADSFKSFLDEFKKYPSSVKIFSKNGKPYETGEIFKQEDLANTLEMIKKYGIDGFYKGKVANLLIKQIKSLGGYITQEDLEKYKVIEKPVVEGTYRGYKIISMPPSSSGGIALIELLNILENYNFSKDDWGSSIYIHRLVEAMKYTYADRTYLLGDEDFYKVPKKGLISKEYAKSIFEKIEARKNQAVPSSQISHGNPEKFIESNETTHYSVYDQFGNAVSVTTTINSAYGSKIVVDGAGFLLNNEMDDFSAKPGEYNQFGLLGTEGNSIQPEKRPLSSMTPTIVLKNDKPFIIIGSPGGSRIITTVLQVILNCIDFGMNIAEAISAPRIHHQWMPDEIYYERLSLSKDVKENLKKMGYKFQEAEQKFTILGLAEGIMIDQENGFIYGASDARGSGAAVGF
ncbi:gamma-glutamyltransferase [Melioribacteraceae bacterium 4301-Me]|uniref:gamma-glutamyltransferase n=1 Tax=Pyranulibacter aquaticus TaxID=3163344 RepID=UPI00359BE388